jgi:anti-anti-sigma factor
VIGEVDSATAPALAGQIATYSRSNTLPLSIDLSAVTHLGSTGISALTDARDRARRQGTDLHLIAPPGSTAYHVLSLVQVVVNSEPESDVVK